MSVLLALGLLISACSAEEDPEDGDDAASADDDQSDDSGDGGDSGDDGDTADTDDGDSGDDGDAAASGEPLRIAVGTEIATLDPQAVSDTSHYAVFGNMFDALLKRNAAGELEAHLATSWEPVEDDTWELEVRDDVEFHNGEAFNAEAAAYSINRMIDPDYGTLATTPISGITGAEAVDDTTLQITTDGPVATLMNQLPYIFMVPPEASASDDFAENPVGSGPYQLAEWDREAQVSLTAYEDYWDGAPTIQEVRFRTMSDSQSALAALQAGEIDLVRDILPEQVDLVPQVLQADGIDFSNIQLNRVGVEELEDPRVAMALQLAIDTQAMGEDLYAGYARPSPGGQHLTSGMVGFNEDLEDFPYDPERAQELLAEAGYPDGFEITLNGAFDRYLKGAEAVELVAAYWTEIGLDVEVALHEWNTYREIGRIPGDESGALDTRYNWNDADSYDASGYYNHVVCGASSSKYCNDDVTRLFNEAQEALDEDVRDQAWQEAWRILREEDVSHIRLGQHDLLYGASERVDWDARSDEFIYVTAVSLS